MLAVSIGFYKAGKEGISWKEALRSRQGPGELTVLFV